jgi:hypothetical protein
MLTLDSIGIQVDGSNIEAWHKTSAGAWTLQMGRTDTTYSAAGRLQVGMWGDAGGATYRCDDVGGGTMRKAMMTPNTGMWGAI